MTDPKLVGVHLGTSSFRTAVYALDGTLLESGEEPIDEQSTVAWERAFREAVPTLPDQAIGSVTSTSGTAILVDEYGEPVFPPQMYYESASEQATRVREAGFSDRPLNWDTVSSPTGPLAKILQLREEHPERFENVEWIVSPTTWLLYRLHHGSSTRWRTVETDWTNAMKFGADVTQSVPEWLDSLFESVGLPRSLFPTIRPPGTYIGVAESELADRTGFDDIKLFQGITDGSAFVIANGCFEPGDFSLTFGATSVIKYVTDSISPHEGLYYHRHPIRGYIAGASFESGNALRWYFDRIIDCAAERGLELASSVAPGDEYDVFLPGGNGPFAETAVGGSILGLDYDPQLSIDDVHGRLARGLTTAIVLSELSYISTIEDHFGTTIDRVQVMNDGAPTHQDDYGWWNQLRASVWDRPVVEMEPRATVGPVIPAAVVTGIYDDSAEAADRLLRQQSSVTADQELAEKYEGQRQTYVDRWSGVKKLTLGAQSPADLP